MSRALDLILAVDAIRAPLTGIGRYAYELAVRLQRHPDVARLRYFAHWRFRAALPPTEGSGGGSGTTDPQWRGIARRIAPLTTFRAARGVLAGYRLRNERDAVFHSPNFVVPRFPGRSVATLHDLSVLSHPEFHPSDRVRYLKGALPSILERASVLITDSQFTRDEVVREFGWPQDRIVAIPLGVDRAFAPRGATEVAQSLAAYGLTPDGYLLVVATIEPRKNIGRLLDAYGTLPAATRTRWPLVIAGDWGWNSAAVHAQIDRATAGGDVRYLGYVADAELPALFAGARAFVFPSLYEGFGLPVAEALASGVPTACANRASLPEVAGGAALLFDPEDTKAMADALARVLEDDSWRSAATVAGLAVARRYDWDVTVDRTVAAYRLASRA